MSPNQTLLLVLLKETHDKGSTTIRSSERNARYPAQLIEGENRRNGRTRGREDVEIDIDIETCFV